MLITAWNRSSRLQILHAIVLLLLLLSGEDVRVSRLNYGPL